MPTELCFVLMPFGKKPDASGVMIDFDVVYEQVIKPAIEQAGLEPIRADEEEGGGMIHTPMFERLVLCTYAVADLTTANANVFYELGVRHAARPATTVLLYGGTARLPFDVQPLRALHYTIDQAGLPENVEPTRTTIARRLRQACEGEVQKDSPLYQLLNDYPNVQHEKTDVFRRQVELGQQRKRRLVVARRARDLGALRAVEQDLEPVQHADAMVVTDLLLSYRDLKAWDAMISLVGRVSRPLAETVLVQEQFALALNRHSLDVRKSGNADAAEELSARAEETLLSLIERRGPSSETYGILGRVYKDRWQVALDAGEEMAAGGYLEQAIDAYRRGFESDWRDAYPGINAVTLLTIHGGMNSERDRLLPVVRYAVERRMANKQADYWDWATLLELAAIHRGEAEGMTALRKMLPILRAPWEAETTARNLGFIRAAHETAGHAEPWIVRVQEELLRKAAR